MNVKALSVKVMVELLIALEDATGRCSIIEGERDEAALLAKSEIEYGSGPTNSGTVVDDVLRELPSFLQTRLQGIPERLQWTDLDLRVRTYNALVRLRRMPRPAALNGMSVHDLMRCKNFGRESLRDLLAALENASGRSCLPIASTALESSAQECASRRQLGVPLDPNARKEENRRSLDLAVGLMKLEQTLGPDVVHTKDPRFGAQVRAIAAGCSDTSQLMSSLPARLGREETGHETRLEALRCLCAGLENARGLSLLAELDAIIRSICTGTHTEMILRLWGWDGRGGATLQQVGDEHGITRERVRQITKAVEERLKARGRIFAPAVTRALEIVQGMLPATTSTVAEALSGEALVPSESQVQFLSDLGEALGRSTAFLFDRQHGCFVSTRAGEEFVKEVYRQAFRIASKYGAACVDDVCDAMRSQPASPPPRPDGVSRLLRTRADLLWLDDEHLWFCKRETGANLLLNRVHKVVAVAGRVRVSELRGGVTRDYRLKGSVPPKAILLSLCSHDPTLVTESDLVAKREGMEIGGALSPAEKTLWRVLIENGPVMERSQLERACIATGLNRPSFQFALTYSPIVIRYAPQVYGLRGVAIPPGAVESVQPSCGSRKGRLLLDSGWTGDGRVRLVYQLSEGCVSNGIITIPASFARFLQADFRLLRVGNPVGTLRCRGNQGWGLGPLFRRAGAEAGDTLTLEVDLHKSEAQASLAAEAPE